MGTVATGAFATAKVLRETLPAFVLSAIGCSNRPPRTIAEGQDERHGQILARGAAICGHRRARRLPIYFDMLPRLETLIVREGEPAWADLLGTRNRYVPGGEELVAEPQNLEFHVPQEATDLKLSVWQEGYDTVREVEVAFPNSIPNKTPVRLSIRMVPGQGNPRIEVKPEDRLAFGGRPVYLDWRRANDKYLEQPCSPACDAG